MTTEEYLVQVLTEDPGVAEVAEERVYADLAPQKAEPRPFIVLEQTSREDDVAMDGPTGLRRVTYEVSSWANRRNEANRLSRAVLAVLEDHEGGAEGVDIQSVIPGAERWDFDPETQLFVATREYELWVSGPED